MTATTRSEGDYPHFVLAAGGERVAASGARATFTDPHEAADAVRAGRVDAVVGALPFDLRDPAALTAPETFGTVAGLGAPAALPTLTRTAEHPAPAEHVDRVRRAVARIETGGDLRKVVLARAVDFAASAPVDPCSVAAALERRDPAGNAFALLLDAAGEAHRGRALVGSTPEILVRRDGDVVSCHPFAGTASSPEGLMDSAKDREEHAYVVDEIAAALAPLCSELDVPGAPSVTRAGEVWHLGTAISGRLKAPSTTALDLALALHPTPAVCGFPRAAAAAAIADLEGRSRGFYAGAIGWTNAAGDGHWRVAIRCAEVAADRMSLRAFAGGGIVGASDPHAELDETVNKLRTVLGPFAIAQPAGQAVAGRAR
ncbi:isochorismate synthase MenF [Tsukamurella sp. 1534]|uniref:isochorismate synthase n=1 Tax=Tsukamurella sp. 1534 TaxID=1151061 RepID=UPI00030C7544|nr:isochorismate synthase [Tsukamurella sp. 1534]